MKTKKKICCDGQAVFGGKNHSMECKSPKPMKYHEQRIKKKFCKHEWRQLLNEEMFYQMFHQVGIILRNHSGYWSNNHFYCIKCLKIKNI